MTDIIKPGQGILFMKVGVHANEPLEDIIRRKSKEIDDAGFALWGYGGNTCHPATMVQPFVKEHADRGETVFLCMQEMVSKHFAEQIRAEQFSVDGVNWGDVPTPINVLGSRYALAIKALRREEFELPLNKAAVAVGNSKGRLGSRYVAGRVDKACFDLMNDVGAPRDASEPTIKISLVAELYSPYAVFLRNRPKSD